MPEPNPFEEFIGGLDPMVESGVLSREDAALCVQQITMMDIMGGLMGTIFLTATEPIVLDGMTDEQNAAHGRLLAKAWALGFIQGILRAQKNLEEEG